RAEVSVAGAGYLASPPGRQGASPAIRRGPCRIPRRRCRVRAGWEAKNRIDLLASRGDAQGAVSLARSIGAFCPGDRIPYAEGYVAIFDGRTLESAFVQGRRVTMCEQFMPETVRVPGRDA
ncbi:hypothetical protein PG2017B_1057, partial [Bifidobacterium pseudolongum subsp. globosum]